VEGKAGKVIWTQALKGPDKQGKHLGSIQKVFFLQLILSKCPLAIIKPLTDSEEEKKETIKNDRVSNNVMFYCYFLDLDSSRHIQNSLNHRTFRS